MNINNPRRYDDDLYTEIGSIKSPENVNQLHKLQKDNPSRAKFLGKLVTSNVLKLGGRSTKKMNKNKKKYKLRCSRCSKKNRKSTKRKCKKYLF